MSEKAVDDLKSATDEALAGLRSLSSDGPEEGSAGSAMQQLVEQMAGVQASADEAMRRRMEESEEKNVKLEATLSNIEEALEEREGELAEAHAKIIQLESMLANQRARSPMKGGRPSTASAIGRARANTAAVENGEFGADEPEEVREARIEHERDQKATERQKRREMEYARLKAEGRLP